MAETLTAALQLDLGQFSQALHTAAQQVSTFAQQINQALQQASQGPQALAAAFAQVMQPLQALTSTFTSHSAAVQANTQALQAQTQVLHQLPQHLAQVTQQMQTQTQATQQAQQATTNWSQALQVTAGLGLVTSIQGLVTGLRTVVTESVQAATKMQALEASFQAITGSVGGAARALAFVRETANRTGTDFVADAEAFKGLAAAARGTSLEGEKVRGVFVAMTEASRVMGLSTDQSRHVLIALEQMLSKGKVSAEELRRQMGNFLPGAFEIAARSMGLTTAQLDQMLKTGQILSEDFLPRFAAQVRKELGPGLAAAAQTAAATFARLGNEVQSLATRTGNAVLTLLQPIAAFVAEQLRKIREAQDQAKAAQNTSAAEALAGKPVLGASSFALPTGATAAETAKAARLLEQLTQLQRQAATLPETAPILQLTSGQIEKLQQEFRALNDVIKARTAYNSSLVDSEELEKGQSGQRIADATARQKKEIAEIVALQKQLPAEIQKAVTISEAFPTIYTKSEEKLAAVKKSIEAIEDKIRVQPTLALLPDVQKTIKQHETLAATYQKEIDLKKEQEQEADRQQRKAEQAAEKAVRDAQKLNEERQALIADIVQGGPFRLRDSGLPQISADLVYFNKLLSTETGPRLDAVRTIFSELHEAERKALGTFPTEIAEGLATMGEAFGKEEHDIKAGQKAADEYTDALAKLDVMLGKTTSTFEAQRIKLRQQITEIQAITGVTPKTEQALSLGLAHIDQEEYTKFQKDNEAAAKKALEPWRELATTLKSTIQSAFEGILTGSLDVWDAIKQGFIKLLANLAALAITPIVINAVMGFAGGLGGLGGLGGASLGGGDMMGTGDMGGAAGGGGIGGSAMGLVGQAASMAGLYRMLGGNALLGDLLSTPIGGIGAAYPGAPTFASNILDSAGLEGLTVGQGVGAIGAGIGGGMLASKLLSSAGLHGMANTTLSGAAGGALAGTMIVPGIGTAIGAAIGALGGMLAGLFSKRDPQPQIRFQNVQAPQIGYNQSTGLTMDQGFAIQNAPFRDVGKFDYGQFLGGLNDAVNGLFTSVIQGFQTATPEVQQQLVAPLNAIAGQLKDKVQGVVISGDNWSKDLQELFNTTLPEQLTQMVKPLQQAVAKVDPLVKEFAQIIQVIQQDIDSLQHQQEAFNSQMRAAETQLSQALWTPSQQFQGGNAQLQGLFQELGTAQESQQGPIAQQIAQLSQQLLQQAKGSFLYDPNASKSLLTGLQTGQEQVAQAVNDFNALLGQWQGSDVQGMTTLAPQITQMANQVLSLAKGQVTTPTMPQDTFDASAITQLQQAMFTQQDLLNTQNQQLQALLHAFGTSDLPTQQQLGNQIGQLADALLESAKAQVAPPTLIQNTFDASSIDRLNQTLMTQAQLQVQQNQQFQMLLQRFQGGDLPTQQGLAGQIGQLADALLESAKGQVAPPTLIQNTFDASGIDRLNQTLLTQAQLQVQQNQQFQMLLQRFQGGDLATQQGLSGQISQLAEALMASAKAQVQAPTMLQSTTDPQTGQRLQQALYSPAQQYMANQQQLQTLMQQFRSGDVATQQVLGPKIEALAEQTLQLARGQDVLGQDAQEVRNAQQQLIQTVNEVENTLTTNIAAANAQAKAQFEQQQKALAEYQQALVQALVQMQQTLTANIDAANAQAQTQFDQQQQALAQYQQALVQALVQMQQTLTANIDAANAQAQAQYQQEQANLAAYQQSLIQNLAWVQQTLALNVAAAQQQVAQATMQQQQQLVALQQWLAGTVQYTQQATQNALLAYQSQIIQGVEVSRQTASAGFDAMIGALQMQLGVAQQAQQTLIASLGNLGSVDAATQQARQLLGEMNSKLGNPLHVSSDQDAVLLAQNVLLQGIVGAAYLQVASLRNIEYLTYRQAGGANQFPNFQLGITKFQHGSHYVPFDMLAMVHAGERISPAYHQTGSEGVTIHITVNGGSDGATVGRQVADQVVRAIELKGTRLASTRIQVAKR